MKTNAIKKYAQSSKLMDVNITFGEESFSFNLFSELVVNENIINKEIKEQPSAAAFLSMLHKKLVRVEADAKKDMEKAYSTMYIMYKEQIDPNTNRPTANELAKEKAIASKKYQSAISKYIQAKENAGIIETCVNSFDARKDLIQTLSANIRKNK